MKNIINPRRLAQAGLLYTAALCGGVGQVQAGAGLVSITRFETARLSAVLEQPAGLASGVCIVDMKFVDGAGRTLAAVQNVQLRPGVAGHLDLPGTRAFAWQSTAGFRPLIRPLISSISGACGNLALTLEMLDSATGQASIVANNN
jgi:hypothetical protein